MHILKLPAWETYFFICPYEPGKLWNVKKYVFQVGILLRGAMCDPGQGGGERQTDYFTLLLFFFNCLTRQTDWGVNWWSCSSACIVLSLCLCQQVEMLIRTLNIQYADCGMGFERRCQRKAGCPLLGFNRDAGQSLPFPASPSTLFTPKIRLDSEQSWLIFKSRNNKRRWRVGGEERGKEDNSCDSGVRCFSFKLVCKFRFLDLSHI